MRFSRSSPSGFRQSGLSGADGAGRAEGAEGSEGADGADGKTGRDGRTAKRGRSLRLSSLFPVCPVFTVCPFRFCPVSVGMGPAIATEVTALGHPSSLLAIVERLMQRLAARYDCRRSRFRPARLCRPGRAGAWNLEAAQSPAGATASRPSSSRKASSIATLSHSIEPRAGSTANRACAGQWKSPPRAGTSSRFSATAGTHCPSSNRSGAARSTTSATWFRSSKPRAPPCTSNRVQS